MKQCYFKHLSKVISHLQLQLSYLVINVLISSPIEKNEIIINEELFERLKSLLSPTYFDCKNNNIFYQFFTMC